MDNVVAEREAGVRAFTFWGTEPTAAIFSQERRAVWDWTNEEEVAAFAASQRPNRFLTAGTVLDGLQQVRVSLLSLHCPCFQVWTVFLVHMPSKASRKAGFVESNAMYSRQLPELAGAERLGGAVVEPW